MVAHPEPRAIARGSTFPGSVALSESFQDSARLLTVPLGRREHAATTEGRRDGICRRSGERDPFVETGLGGAAATASHGSQFGDDDDGWPRVTVPSLPGMTRPPMASARQSGMASGNPPVRRSSVCSTGSRATSPYATPRRSESWERDVMASRSPSSRQRRFRARRSRRWQRQTQRRRCPDDPRGASPPSPV